MGAKDAGSLIGKVANAADRNGYLPTHNRKFLQPQSAGPRPGPALGRRAHRLQGVSGRGRG